MEDRLLSSYKNNEDDDELKLRPSNLSEYIGQAKIKESLNILIASSKIRKIVYENLLIDYLFH